MFIRLFRADAVLSYRKGRPVGSAELDAHKLIFKDSRAIWNLMDVESPLTDHYMTLTRRPLRRMHR